jgi:aspartate-semialdehyde dehydrogenase
MAAVRAVAARRRAHLAVFDATTLTAKSVKEQLIERSFPVASMNLFTSRDDPEANLSEFAGEAKLITAPEIDTLGKLDIAFLCGTREQGTLYLDWAGTKGFSAIDLTTAACESARTPLVNAAVNPHEIPPGPGVIATPHPIALFISSLLDPIRSGCGLTDATVVVIEPASDGGDAGIEELHRQTVGALNFQDLPREIFGRQLAFNVIPSFLQKTGPEGAGGRPERLEGQVLKVTGGGYGLALEVVQAPVFHCHAALARVVLGAGRGREDLAAALEASPEIRVLGDDEPATPVERAGQSGVMVAGLRAAGAPPAFWLWAVFDNLISGTTLNAVRIAETLLKRGFARGDA